jgi:acyl-CoA synthetase (AMP-forming)/AMP-acid ligase II
MHNDDNATALSASRSERSPVVTATLDHMLAESASAWPDRVAVGAASEQRAITYAELNAAVSDLADRLTQRGIAKGDAVAVISDNCVEYVVALFALFRAGAIAAPLNPNLSRPQLRRTLASVHARAAIAPGHLYDEFASTDLSFPLWKLEMTSGQTRRQAVLADATPAPEASGGAAVPAGDLPSGDDVALLMLTSGTSAAPKLVPLTHANLLASISGIRATYRLTPEDATLLVMPLFHGHGLIAGLLATLASGGAGFLPRGGRFHASTFWSEMSAARATWYTAVPTIHQILLARIGTEYPEGGYPHLRFVRSCSAPLAGAVLSEMEATFSAPVLEAYGMTETAHQAASNPLPGNGPHKPGSVGVATNVEIQVTRPSGHPAASRETGEIWVRGAAVSTGYLDNPAATAESFSRGWFRTGDLGHQDPDGYLSLTGRIGEIINRGGEKIAPAAVDAVLLSHPDLQDALSFAVPDEKYGAEIEAAVVVAPGHTTSEDDVARYARSRLSPFEVPKRILFVSDLPRTPKGAGDRRRLAQLLAPKE